MENTINQKVELSVVRETLDFVDYVLAFYNDKDGVYKIKGLETAHVTDAIYYYILHNQQRWGGGDSTDRENVRDIILTRNSHLTMDWS